MPAPNQPTYPARDSTRTYSRRPTPKKRTFVEQAHHDFTVGLPEVIRKVQFAAGKVKEGYRRVKKFLDTGK